MDYLDLENFFDFAVIQTKSQFYEWAKVSDEVVRHHLVIEDKFDKLRF